MHYLYNRKFIEYNTTVLYFNTVFSIVDNGNSVLETQKSVTRKLNTNIETKANSLRLTDFSP